MRFYLLPLGAASLVSVAGCGLPPTGDGPDAEASSSSAAALVVVERSAGPGDAVRGDAMVARFLRVTSGAVEDSALRSAGALLELPSGCAAPAASLTAAKNVELLEVGALTFEGQKKATSLLPRVMPDPGSVVNGVFYSARTAEAFGAGERVVIRAGGSEALPEGFSTTVSAPRDVTEVVVTPSPAGLDITWDADAATGDLVYVDVTAGGSLVLRCTTPDAGRFFVPLAAGAGADDGQVAVHRLHREAFKTKGIDPGEVRFDVSRVESFRR